MKKGFTLIELLAIIVVLAILSLIVVPIISKTINNSQINIDKRSLEQYVRAIETSYYNEKANTPSLTPQKYIDEYLSQLEYKGSKVECSSIELSGKKIEDIELYDCKVDNRKFYSYIENKVKKVEGRSIFKITNNLFNVINSNTLKTIRNGKSYKTILVVDGDYEVRNISVTMDGKDITDSVYNNKEITIEKVTGDIEITATSSQTVTITNNLTNVTSNNDETEIYIGESYSLALTPTNLYSITTITITMNGEDITSSVYSDGNINITNVTGDIIITAKAEQTTFTVTNNLTNVTSNGASTVEKSNSYNAILTSTTTY